jgi:hypothetical protein
MLIPDLPISKYDIKFDPNVQTLTPIFSGPRQRLQRGAARTSIEVETDSLLWSDAQRIGTILKLGQTQVVQFNIPTGDIITSGFGTSVKAQSGSGRTLVLKNATPNKTFKSGQYVTVKYSKSGTVISYLEQITSDATVAANGVVTLSVLPSLKRTSNLANSVIEIEKPYIEGFVMDDGQTTTTSQYRLKTAKLSFSIEEIE